MDGGLPVKAVADKIVLVRKLLAKADPDQARAALCVYVDGMSHAEASEILEVSRRTVGNLLDRFNTWAQNYLKVQDTEEAEALERR
jgi:RNA polymerase sigma-70 factor (ECF subfamily)